jgi:hypothetical protein
MGTALDTVTTNLSCALLVSGDTAGVFESMELEAMTRTSRKIFLWGAAGLLFSATFAGVTRCAIKNLAVIVSAGSKLSDIPLADLTKLCKGAQKTLPDGKNFQLVIKNPASAEMRVAAQKLFGAAGPEEVKPAIAKLNESRQLIKIVESDEELLHTVEATPGAVGLLDVYLINSSVKVLRVDGKLPFDPGYALKGN